MLIIAFIWVLFGAIAIGVGVENEETWRSKLNLGTMVDRVRRFLFIAGVIISAVAIVASFYYFVFKNALIILITWVVTFALVRVIIEILVRRTIGDSLPPPVSRASHNANPAPPAYVESPDGLHDIGEVEEIESNLEFSNLSAGEPKIDAGLSGDLTKIVPLSHRDESRIEKPQLEQGDARSNEYNELFDRINNPEKNK